MKAIRHPVRISERSGGVQHTIATFNMTVGLPHHFKGTHMSRFVAWLNDQDARSDALDAHALREGLEDMLQRLTADEGRIEASFTFFISDEVRYSDRR